MAFFLFLLLNAVLFVRPAEIVPALKGVELYLYVVLPTIAASLPAVFKTLFEKPLLEQPLTVCVFGLFVTLLIPNIVEWNPAELWRTGFHFFKIVVYYILFVSLVTTPTRMQITLGTIVLCCTTLTALTILNHLDYIELPDLPNIESNEFDPITNQEVKIRRLLATGIFQDPNDLCVLLAMVLVPAIYLALHDPVWARKLLWYGSAAIFAYGIHLTKSRGGILAITGAGAVALFFRMGWKKFLVLATVASPIFMGVVGMMLTDRRGTSNSRIQLWSDWLQRFRESPIFGEGMNLPVIDANVKTYDLENSFHLAHNSYLQSHADMGIIGGSLFLGSFLLANWLLARYSFYNLRILDPKIEKMRPYLLGTVAAYSVGMFTLSLCYVIPTYLALAIATSYVNMTTTWPPAKPVLFDGVMPLKLGALSVGFIVFLYIFVRIFVRWG